MFPSVDKPPWIKAPPKISSSKRAFEKYKPLGLFSEFYSTLHEAISSLLYLVLSFKYHRNINDKNSLSIFIIFID